MTIEPASADVAGRLQRPDTVTIISFGYLHGAPPEAHAVFDVRHHFGNPDLGPGLRELTGEHPAVVKAVLANYATRDLVDVITRTAWVYLHSCQGSVVIAVGCDDGRQHSVAIAGDAATLLGYENTPVRVYDRDINRHVAVPRPTP